MVFMSITLEGEASTVAPAVEGAPLPRNGSGSEHEWAEVYCAHASSVLAFARNLLGNTAMAEEVVQDVFVRLWKRSETFDPTRGSLRSYLLTQTRWRCIDLIRAEESRRKRERRVASTAQVYVVPHWEEKYAAAEMKEGVDAVLGALVELPVEERLPIHLAYFGGLTHKEVAVVLEWPEGTVKSRIRRGLHRMRGEVEKRSEAG